MLQFNDLNPRATLQFPRVLFPKAPHPTAVFSLPVVLFLNAQKPTAVLFEAVFNWRAYLPRAVLLPPVVL